MALLDADDDMLDSEDPDLRAAFMQLQHNHRMLLQQKEEVERYCMDMEETREDKERMIVQLRSHNNKLSRELGSVKMTSEELAAHLLEVEQDRQRAAQRSIRPPPPTSCNEEDLDMRPPVSPPPVDTDSLSEKGLRAIVTEQELALRLLRRKQRAYQQEIRRLRQCLSDLETDPQQHKQRTSDIFNLDDSTLLDSLDEIDGSNVEHVLLAEPQLGKAVMVNARKHLEYQQTLQQRVQLSQAELSQKVSTISALRDELDMALAKLEETEKELARVQHDRTGGDLDMSLADEMNAPRVIKGMTLEEQTLIITERVEFKLEVERLKEAVVDSILLASKWQWKEQTMRVYTHERDKSIYQILEKPLGKKDRQKFLRILKKTALTDQGVDDSEAY